MGIQGIYINVKEVTVAIHHRVQVFLNSTFQAIPHPNFYVNCVTEHLKKNHAHMPQKQKEVWKQVYLDKLKHGEIVKVNNLYFKLP